MDVSAAANSASLVSEIARTLLLPSTAMIVGPDNDRIGGRIEVEAAVRSGRPFFGTLHGGFVAVDLDGPTGEAIPSGAGPAAESIVSAEWESLKRTVLDLGLRFLECSSGGGELRRHLLVSTTDQHGTDRKVEVRRAVKLVKDFLRLNELADPHLLECRTAIRPPGAPHRSSGGVSIPIAIDGMSLDAESRWVRTLEFVRSVPFAQPTVRVAPARRSFAAVERRLLCDALPADVLAAARKESLPTWLKARVPEETHRWNFWTARLLHRLGFSSDWFFHLVDSGELVLPSGPRERGYAERTWKNATSGDTTTTRLYGELVAAFRSCVRRLDAGRRTPGVRKVLEVLLELAVQRGSRQVVVDERTLVDLSGLTRKSVAGALRVAVELGFLVSDRRFSRRSAGDWDRHRWDTSTYELRLPEGSLETVSEWGLDWGWRVSRCHAAFDYCAVGGSPYDVLRACEAPSTLPEIFERMTPKPSMTWLRNIVRRLSSTAPVLLVATGDRYGLAPNLIEALDEIAGERAVDDRALRAARGRHERCAFELRRLQTVKRLSFSERQRIATVVWAALGTPADCPLVPVGGACHVRDEQTGKVRVVWSFEDKSTGAQIVSADIERYVLACAATYRGDPDPSFEIASEDRGVSVVQVRRSRLRRRKPGAGVRPQGRRSRRRTRRANCTVMAGPRRRKQARRPGRRPAPRLPFPSHRTTKRESAYQ